MPLHPANAISLDAVDIKLLRLLQERARLSFKELGLAVHLSSTSAAERVRRLEEAGVIVGYQARLAPERLGRPINAFIRLRTAAELYPRVLAELERRAEVTECHHVTGDDSFLIKAALVSMADLEDLIACLGPFGETSTALVLSTPLERPLPCG